MKKIKILLIILLTIISLCSFYILNSPYEKIRDYNEDLGISPFTYLRIYKRVFPKNKFDKLIDRLVTENMDIKSVNITAEFCRIEKLYEYIPILEQKCKYFSTFPKDSIWEVKISENNTRESGTSQLELPNNIYENLHKLKESRLSDSLKTTK
ncbi:MAG TPA: hypothetical protein VK796_02780 [Cytophaga sp.]|jgi:hypothetical protein|nr:hypothetical protein [Cytophaga sp.]